MGHVGLTPQTATALGGYRSQGRTAERALEVASDALALQEAGCFAIVFEAIPSDVTDADHAAARDPGDRHRRRAGHRRPGAGVPRPARHLRRPRRPLRQALRRRARADDRRRARVRRRRARRAATRSPSTATRWRPTSVERLRGACWTATGEPFTGGPSAIAVHIGRAPLLDRGRRRRGRPHRRACRAWSRQSGVETGVASVFVPGSTAAVTRDGVRAGRGARPAGRARAADPARGRLRAQPAQRTTPTRTPTSGRRSWARPRRSRWRTAELETGTWQQVVLVDFDDRPRERRVVVQVVG